MVAPASRRHVSLDNSFCVNRTLPGGSRRHIFSHDALSRRYQQSPWHTRNDFALSWLVAGGLGELAIGVIRPPLAELLVGDVFTFVIQCSVGMVSLPDARFLFILKRTGLHQLPVLAIPFPLARHLSARVSADGSQRSVTQVVLPLAGLLAVAVFADA